MGCGNKSLHLGKGLVQKLQTGPPVSEFESPKLNMAGKEHDLTEMLGLGSTNVAQITRPKRT